MQTLRLKHLVAIRWFHWINFPLLFLMIWSGFLIYWAYPDLPYRAHSARSRLALSNLPHGPSPGGRHGAALLVHVAVRDQWHSLCRLHSHLRRVAFVGSALSINISRRLVRCFCTTSDCTKKLPTQEKYNAAQQVSYSAIIVMGVGSVLTGLAIYKPAQLSWLTASFGGYQPARFIHFMLTIGYLAFFVVHVAQVVRAGWNNFRSMVIGYELVKDDE